jgi:hypothetical protein
MVLKAVKSINQLTPEQRQHFVTLNDEILHSYWSNNALAELSSGKISLIHSIPKFYSVFCSSNSDLFDFLLLEAKKNLLASIQIDIIGKAYKNSSSEADRTRLIIPRNLYIPVEWCTVGYTLPVVNSPQLTFALLRRIRQEPISPPLTPRDVIVPVDKGSPWVIDSSPSKKGRNSAYDYKNTDISKHEKTKDHMKQTAKLRKTNFSKFFRYSADSLRNETKAIEATEKCREAISKLNELKKKMKSVEAVKNVEAFVESVKQKRKAVRKIKNLKIQNDTSISKLSNSLVFPLISSRAISIDDSGLENVMANLIKYNFSDFSDGDARNLLYVDCNVPMISIMNAIIHLEKYIADVIPIESGSKRALTYARTAIVLNK